MQDLAPCTPTISELLSGEVPLKSINCLCSPRRSTNVHYGSIQLYVPLNVFVLKLLLLLGSVACRAKCEIAPLMTSHVEALPLYTL